jgi:hypothetical protein
MGGMEDMEGMEDMGIMEDIFHPNMATLLSMDITFSLSMVTFKHSMATPSLTMDMCNHSMATFNHMASTCKLILTATHLTMALMVIPMAISHTEAMADMETIIEFLSNSYFHHLFNFHFHHLNK